MVCWATLLGVMLSAAHNSMTSHWVPAQPPSGVAITPTVSQRVRCLQRWQGSQVPGSAPAGGHRAWSLCSQHASKLRLTCHANTLMPAIPACRGTSSCLREAQPVCCSVCGGGGASSPQAGPALLPEAGACTLPPGGQAGLTAGQAQPRSLGCCRPGLPPPGITAAWQVSRLLKLHLTMGHGEGCQNRAVPAFRLGQGAFQGLSCLADQSLHGAQTASAGVSELRSLCCCGAGRPSPGFLDVWQVRCRLQQRSGSRL